MWLKESYRNYYEEKSKNNFFYLETVRMFDVDSNLKEIKNRKGKYFLVSPFVYNRFLKNSGLNYDAERLRQLNGFKKYYSFYKKERLVASFNKYKGTQFEIYYIE